MDETNLSFVGSGTCTWDPCLLHLRAKSVLRQSLTCYDRKKKSIHQLHWCLSQTVTNRLKAKLWNTPFSPRFHKTVDGTFLGITLAFSSSYNGHCIRHWAQAQQPAISIMEREWLSLKGALPGVLVISLFSCILAISFTKVASPNLLPSVGAPQLPCLFPLAVWSLLEWSLSRIGPWEPPLESFVLPGFGESTHYVCSEYLNSGWVSVPRGSPGLHSHLTQLHYFGLSLRAWPVPALLKALPSFFQSLLLLTRSLPSSSLVSDDPGPGCFLQISQACPHSDLCGVTGISERVGTTLNVIPGTGHMV